MSTMGTDSCKIAVCQLTATNDKTETLKTVQRLISKAAKENVKVAFFPEACDYIGSSKDETINLAETLDGSTMQEYRAFAEQYDTWLSICFHEKANVEGTESKLYNSHVLISNKGIVQAVYRKLHLFDVSIPEKNILQKESDNTKSGQEIVLPVQSPVGHIGLATCYDLRFPELSVILRKLGASILTFPSAFMVSTGKAHWEALLKARAIENQCYVVAAAQYGQHNPNRSSHGQAVIIDPWGKIIAECPTYSKDVPSNESLAIATIDHSLLSKIRQEMPILEHRRSDIYQLKIVENRPPLIEDTPSFMFADKIIPASTVFYRSHLCYAFTNIRCVVPGHVLVSSFRRIPRLEDLTQEEVADFFQTVVKVQKIMEKTYSCTSSTICVQDGKYAGQTIPHVHCHILPRKPGDFDRNDDIYEKLAMHDREANPEPLRSLEEMAQEATLLRNYFIQ